MRNRSAVQLSLIAFALPLPFVDVPRWAIAGPFDKRTPAGGAEGFLPSGGSV